MSNHQFCRDVCLERGEPLEGTGNAPERVLLLPWPRGKWRTPRWESAGMSAELSAAVHYASQNGVHLALVDRVGHTENLPGLMAQPESVFADFTSETDLIAVIRNYADGGMFTGEVDPRVTILVCTDSRRDACCARYGFSTFKALTAIADSTRFNIVQATHIGGCRFAASLLVLPQRQRYGRMTAGQVPAFLESLLRNEIFLPAYKGRTDAPEPFQVAELAALTWASEHKHSVRQVHIHPEAMPEDAHDGTEMWLRADVSGERLNIKLLATTFMVHGNCNVLAEERGENQLRWCLAELNEQSTNRNSI